MNSQALLFDLDGTLIDSMPLHNQAWIEILSEEGYPMTHEILTEYMGIPNFKTVQIFNGRFGWNLDPYKITALKEKRFLEKLNQVQIIDVTLDVVRKNFGQCPMAIVTGSVKQPVIEILKLLDIEKYFSVVITAEDTEKHKPEPEPFLLAAQRLGVQPQQCLVYEDGDLGIQAAHAAGMKVVKVVPDKSAPFFRLVPL